MTKKLVLAAACLALLPAPVARAQEKETRRLDACREVLEELLSGEESIPRDLLDKAECVAVIPSAKKFAIGVGGRYGKGAVSCRSKTGSGWGAPLMISIGGGSFGLQIGGQAADYVFLVMNPTNHFFPSVVLVIAWLLARSLILAVASRRAGGSVRTWTVISAGMDFVLALLLATGLSVATIVISLFGPTQPLVASFAWVLAASFVVNGLMLLEVASCEREAGT